MNEWMNEWTKNERMNELINERIKECGLTIKQTNETKTYQRTAGRTM